MVDNVCRVSQYNLIFHLTRSVENFNYIQLELRKVTGTKSCKQLQRYFNYFLILEGYQTRDDENTTKSA